MPLVQVPFPSEILPRFLGVNLRQDRLSIADDECARAINADFHAIVGSISVRRGYTLLVTGGSSAVRTLARHESRRYHADGTVLYRDGSSIVTGLAGTQTSVLPFRPLNDTTTWSFIADPNTMQKDNGTTVRNWGIAAPLAGASLAVGAAGSLTGDYSARYTYVRKVGSAVAHESNPSAVVTAIALTADQLNIDVVASADAQVTHIRIYRTVAGGTSYLYDQEVANATATVASSQADATLGTAVETNNDRPPSAGVAAAFQEHLFLVGDASNPHYLWYSKRFRPESWPTDHYLELGNPSDPLQAMAPLTGQLGVLSKLTKYRVVGNAVSGFTAQEALNTRGTLAPQAVVVGSIGAVFVARDGLYASNFVGEDTEISGDIQPLFFGETVNDYLPIDLTATTALSLAEWKRRLYFNYVDTGGARFTAVYSFDTRHWYHYQYANASHRLYTEEDTDQLVMGDTAGKVYTVEQDVITDAGTAITATVQTALRGFGTAASLKPARWALVDKDTGWTVAFRLDGTTRSTVTGTSSRARAFTAFAEPYMLHTWDAVCTGTAGSLYSLGIGESGPPDGQVWIEDATGNVARILQPAAPLPPGRKAVRYLLLDMETASGESWTLSLFVDDVERWTDTVSADRPRRLVALPEGLVGYSWYLRAQYSTSPPLALYSATALDTGAIDGQVLIRDSEMDGQFLQILPAQTPQLPYQLKRLRYLQLDADAPSGAWTIYVYVDGTLRHSATVAGNRTHTRVHLPQSCLGYRWHVELANADTPVPHVYGVLMHAEGLQLA